MTNEFKALLRNVLGAVALASLFSYLTFVAPSDEQSDKLSLDEEFQEKNINEFDRSGNEPGGSNGAKRELANFSDEVSKEQVARKDRSRTSVGARTSRPDREARDPAYNSREIEGSSNSGNFFVGNNIQASTPPFIPSPDSPPPPESKPKGPPPDKNRECKHCVSGPPNLPEDPTPPTNSNSPDEPDSRSNSVAVTQVTCSQDMAEGSYATAISVTISCSETATIFYCLDTGGSPCTPTIQYTAPINLPTDGSYGISYYADASASSTEVDDLLYTIDTTGPDLSVSHDVIYAQTTQVPLQNTTTSTDFGVPDYYYHQINFKSFNPLTASTPWTCSEVLSDYATASPTPQVIQSDFPTSGLTVADQIIQTNDMPSLVIGDNHIMTVLEDRALGVVSCQVQNVVVRDFAIADFTGTGGTPVTTGVRRTLGSFVGFGHFQATPNTSSAGQLSNTQGATSNKQGLYTLTH